MEEAPAVPPEYWKELRTIAHRRITLAGYPMADRIVAAADPILAKRALAGQVLDSLPKHGAPSGDDERADDTSSPDESLWIMSARNLRDVGGYKTCDGEGRSRLSCQPAQWIQP